MTSADLLKRFLGHMYRADVLGQGDMQAALRFTREQIASSDEMRALAAQRVAELEPLVRKRGKESAHAETNELKYLKMAMEPDNG